MCLYFEAFGRSDDPRSWRVEVFVIFMNGEVEFFFFSSLCVHTEEQGSNFTSLRKTRGPRGDGRTAREWGKGRLAELPIAPPEM